MIEPQNTVFPVAAEPRPAQQPQGEEAGFGAMLAQSLGLTSQLDPGALQQIISGHHRQGETTDDGMTDDNMAEDANRSSANTAPNVPGMKATPLPLVASVTAPNLDAVGRFGPVDAVPLAGDSSVPLPTTIVTDQSAGVEVPTATAKDHLLITPAVQINGGEPESVDQADAALQPVLTDKASPMPPAIDGAGREAVIGPEAFDLDEPIGSPPVDDVGHGSVTGPAPQLVADPVPRPVTAGNATEPVAQPLPDSSAAVPLAQDVQPAPVQKRENRQPEPAEPPRSVIPAADNAKAGADMPVPRVTAPAETAEPTVVAEIAKGSTGSTTVAPPTQTTEPRIDLAPEVPVQVDMPSRAVTVVAADVSTDAAASVVADGGPANAPVSFSAPSTSPAPIANPDSPAEPPAAQTSALAERVLQAVDLQRTQPPPRSMVVDIPEIEGLRLVVSVRTGGQVSVTQAGGANADAFTPFAEDLSRVLSQRGFVMNGDDRRHSHNPHTDEERAPFRAPRRNSRRPVQPRRDNDLRI